MQTNLIFKGLGVFVLLVLLVGCQRPPTQALEQAQAALAAADSTEADRYVPELYGEASDALAEAQREIDAGNYAEARTLLETARDKATTAIEQTPTRKEEMRTETETWVMEAEDAMNRLTEAARRTRNRTNRAALQAGVQELTSALEDARQALERGDVKTAHEWGQAASAQADTLMNTLLRVK